MDDLMQRREAEVQFFFNVSVLLRKKSEPSWGWGGGRGKQVATTHPHEAKEKGNPGLSVTDIKDRQ